MLGSTPEQHVHVLIAQSYPRGYRIAQFAHHHRDMRRVFHTLNQWGK